MKNFHLEKMVKGWFVGGFSPTALSTDACEVALKSYKSGDYEGEHYHKISTEVTLIISGRVQMLGQEWGEGDIIVLNPNTVTDFYAITDVVNVVVKVPGAVNDKYEGRPEFSYIS
jgi:hypothetical protein